MVDGANSSATSAKRKLDVFSPIIGNIADIQHGRTLTSPHDFAAVMVPRYILAGLGLTLIALWLLHLGSDADSSTDGRRPTGLTAFCFDAKGGQYSVGAMIRSEGDRFRCEATGRWQRVSREPEARLAPSDKLHPVVRRDQ